MSTLFSIKKHKPYVYSWSIFDGFEKTDCDEPCTSITGCLNSALQALPNDESERISISYNQRNVGTFFIVELTEATEMVADQIAWQV